MASVRKRQWQTKDGIKTAWIADYFAPDRTGKMVRRLKTFKLKGAAQGWLDDIAKPQIKQGTHQPDSTSHTLGEAADAWIAHGEADGLERSTMTQRREHVAHILPLLGAGTKLSKITINRLESFRNDLLLQLSRSTAPKVIVSLKAILRQARAAHLATADLSIKSNKRHKKPLKAGVDFPTTQEVNEMIKAAAGNPKALAFVCLTAFAGLRASEVRGLAWSHLELGSTPKVVAIEQRADKWCAIGSPKSAAAHRTVGLNETTVHALRAWKLAQENGRTLVFGTRSDKPDVLGNLQRRLVDPLLASAGIKHYSAHKFRHFAISSWLKTCNGDFKAVQVRAGHATLTLTLDTYGHLLGKAGEADQMAAAEKLVLG